MSSVFHPRDLGGTTRGGGSIGGPGMGGTGTGGTGGADNTGTGTAGTAGTGGTGSTGDMLTKGGGGMAPASPHFSQTPSPFFSSLPCGFGSLFVYIFNTFYLFKTYDSMTYGILCLFVTSSKLQTPSLARQSHRVVPGA